MENQRKYLEADSHHDKTGDDKGSRYAVVGSDE